MPGAFYPRGKVDGSEGWQFKLLFGSQRQPSLSSMCPLCVEHKGYWGGGTGEQPQTLGFVAGPGHLWDQMHPCVCSTQFLRLHPHSKGSGIGECHCSFCSQISPQASSQQLTVTRDQNQNKSSMEPVRESQMWKSSSLGLSGKPGTWLVGGRDGLLRVGPDRVDSGQGSWGW